MKSERRGSPIFTLEMAKSLVAARSLPPEVVQALLAAGAPTADAAAWQRLLSALLAFVGAGLSLAGVICFVAYHGSGFWALLGPQYGKFVQIGLLELAMAAAIWGAWKSANRLAGRVWLMTAALLLGPLLAVYGQNYQTGADPYELFLGWLLLTLPWVVLARLPALWVFSWALLNGTFLLFWKQVLVESFPFGQSVPIYLALAAVNALAWALWEFFEQRGCSWMAPRWPPRLMAVASHASVVLGAGRFIAGEATQTEGYGVLAVCVAGAMVAATVFYYRSASPDLFMLTLAAASAMTMLTVACARFLAATLASEEGVLLLMGNLVVAQAAGAAFWLRWEGRRRRGGQQALATHRGVAP